MSARISRKNPIVKTVTSHAMSFGTGRVYQNKTWGYECECGKTQHDNYFGRRMQTRKQARDAYHEHRLQDHDGPDWVSSHRGAQPAPPSPRQGLAETSAKRDELVSGLTPLPVTNPSP